MVPAPSPDVVAALRAWRLDEARRRAVPAFVVLHDRALEAIAASRPRSLDEIQAKSRDRSWQACGDGRRFWRWWSNRWVGG